MIGMVKIDSKAATEICDEELWNRISPYNCNKSNSRLPVDWVYFAFRHNGEFIGFWIYHYLSNKNIGIHINILKQFRSDFGFLAGAMLLEYISRNLSDVETIKAEIPCCYPDVIRFSEKFGFNRESLNPKSIIKNGMATDQVILSLKTEDIKNGCS